MTNQFVYFWKKNPFIRLVIPLMMGISLQWQLQLLRANWWIALSLSAAFLGCYFILPFFQRFKWNWVGGMAGAVMLISTGGILTWSKDVRHHKNWFGHQLSHEPTFVVSLDEPWQAKANSQKANASVNMIIVNGEPFTVCGKIILYIRKDSAARIPSYPSTIVFSKTIQEIKNTGNPGGFDYQRYCLFQGITHQVYLSNGEFVAISSNKILSLNKLLYDIRDHILSILRKGIKGERECGLAEALLIGYKDDLDKELVQSYSNTGVVHIIAISGMHLGLIYWVINLILSPLGKRKKWKWIKPIVSVALLWLFSLLTGGSASVLRAAVMFTFIVIGDNLGQKSSVYNSLAASAFCLLCYNPFWLWDVGFQLSYAAVLSIVLFMRPVYNLFYFKNKILDSCWKLNAVTFAAQILTTPLSIYHFHQFPVYFFLTNFFAVPLSSAIVLAEILLCAIAFIPVIASLVGKVIAFLILLMNSYVERIESLPGSIWSGLQISGLQSLLLYVAIAGMSFWLLEKIKAAALIAMIALLCFFAERSRSFIVATRQHGMIIYNVPRRRAVDFINGRNYLFFDDSAQMLTAAEVNFHLKPARIQFRLIPNESLNDLLSCGNIVLFHNKKVLFIDSVTNAFGKNDTTIFDWVIISRSPGLNVSELLKNIHTRMVIFDASVPYWKVNRWKKECDSFHVQSYDVSEKGAFVINVN